MKYRNTVLSKREREDILRFLVENKKLNMNFRLTQNEVLRIKKLENPHLRIGYALQLLYLRFSGININGMTNMIPENIVNFVASQLDCSPKYLQEYWEIRCTRGRHFQKITKYLGYSKFEYSSDTEKIFHKAVLSNGNSLNMVKEVFETLKMERIIAPPLQVIEHFLWLANEKAESKIYRNILTQMENFSGLHGLLDIESTGTSVYSRIKSLTVSPNSGGVKELPK